MTQRQRNTSGQRSANHETEWDLFDPMPCESNYFKRELFIDFNHWQNIAETKRPWYEYNHNVQSRKENDILQRMIIPCINEIITSGLTNRQKEVVSMYFLSNHTQVYIAKALGISQPTVNQHLNGKKRNGKMIGGSIRKIRKLIHRISSKKNRNHSKSHIINILDQLLDKTTTLRKSHSLIQSMLKEHGDY